MDQGVDGHEGVQNMLQGAKGRRIPKSDRFARFVNRGFDATEYSPEANPVEQEVCSHSASTPLRPP
jgi:hypothetical protein